jgi:CRISPR/Cas system-associated exonuclease Cas4 (RecB family)
MSTCENNLKKYDIKLLRYIMYFDILASQLALLETHKTRYILKELKHLSISQLNKFQDCPRQHYYQYVLGLEAPSTTSQEYGKQCHEILEHFLKGEISEFPDTYHGRTCMSAKHLLPQPKSGEVEKYFELQISEVPAPVIGYMDYCTTQPVEGKVFLLDHKIVKSDQFLLTEEKLATTTQVVTYSKHLLDTCSADVVEASYLYIKRGGGFAKKVTVELSRDDVEETFESIADGFRQLAKNYTTQNEDSVPQILASCSKWGGCPFKDRCWGTRKGDTDMAPYSLSDLMSTLRTSKTPNTATTPNAVAPTQAAPVSQAATTTRKSIFDQISSAPVVPVAPATTEEPKAALPASPIPAPIASSTTDVFVPAGIASKDIFSSSEDDDDDDERPAAVTASELFSVAAESEPAIHVLTSVDSEAVSTDWDDIALSINAPEYEAATLVTSKGSVSVAAKASDIAEDTPEANIGDLSIDQIQEEVLAVAIQEDMAKLASSEAEVPVSEEVIITTQEATTPIVPKAVIDWSWLDADLADNTKLQNKTKKALLGSGHSTLRRIFWLEQDPALWAKLSGVKGYGPVCQKDLQAFIESEIGGFFITYSDLEKLGAPALNYTTVEASVEAPTSDDETVDIFPTLEQATQIANAVIAKAAEDAQNQSAVSAVSTSAPAPAPAPTKPAAPAQANVEQPKAAKPQPQGFGRLLLLGVLPVKGLDFNVLDDLLEPYENQIAETNAQPHISLVAFSKGYDQLAAGVKLMLAKGDFDWSKPIYISQQAQITYAKVLSVLMQHADLVLKNA